MAADAGTLELNFKARLDQLEHDMNQAKSKVSRAADDMGDDVNHRLGSKLGNLGATVGKAAILGVGAAAAGVGLVLKGAFEAAEESRKVGAQTEAVIKSTGGAAKVSAKEVASLSDEIAGFTGIDDEMIASGANMLLTFTNVRNEVGKGNNVFDQATMAATNMSVALGKDLPSSAMLVGKALNDPIAGMTALTRSGIQFTAQQKEQVKAMVAAGDTLGAQKVILKELETQFGGSAEAAASPMARLKVVVGNLQEELGARLLPVVGKVATFLADKLPGALDRAGAAIGPVIATVRSGWDAIVGGFQNADASIGASVGGVEGFFLRLGAVARQVVDWFVANWPQIRATVSDVLSTVQAVIAGFVDVALTIWNNFGSQIISYVQGSFNAAMEIIGGAMEFIRGIIATVTAIIHGDWSAAWEGIKQVLAGAWDMIIGLTHQWSNMMQTLISVAMEILGSIIRSAFNGIVDFIASIPGRILGALGDLGSLLVAAGRALMEGLLAGIKSGAGKVYDFVKGIAPAIIALKGPLDYDKRILTPAGHAIMGGLVKGLRDHENQLVRQLTHVTGLIDDVSGTDALQAAAGRYSASLSMAGAGHSGGDSGGTSASGARPINVGPFYVRENDLPTEIPRRLRGALHMWDR